MGFQCENRKIFTMGTVSIEFFALFMEPHLPCDPLVADLNHFHKHSNISYGDLFGRGRFESGGWNGGRRLGQSI